jgi:hypothetical protein
MIHRRLGQKEHPEDIGLEGSPELLFADVANVLVGVLLAGIVDEDVEAAELIDGLADRGLAKGLVADVAGDGERLAPFLLDDVPGLFVASSCSHR